MCRSKWIWKWFIVIHLKTISEIVADLSLPKYLRNIRIEEDQRKLLGMKMNRKIFHELK